jgi:secondary thiamine-phosphate synthase enzyme
MKVIADTLQVQSKGENHTIDVTNDVQDVIQRSSISNGLVTIFVAGSTGAVTTIEYEPGLLKDFPAMLERVAPKGAGYEHEKAWHDGNGHSHVRASLIGPSLTVPIVDGKLTLGTWQQIVFVELDLRPRSRTLVVQIVGE